MPKDSLGTKCAAEFVGTFWLVLGGCGSAVIAGHFPYDAAPMKDANFFGLGFLGVALAFGLTVLTGAYALGHISGAHFNPAVSVGLWTGQRFPPNELIPYVIAQVLGGTMGGGLTYLIASGRPGFTLAGSNPLATNGYAAHSPGGYSLLACLIVEVVLTFMFLLIILGVTDVSAPHGFAPITIGLALTLIHLISIPVTATSVNPARSTGVAIFAGGDSIGQLCLFWLAPLLGAVAAGLVYTGVFGGADR